MNIALKLMANIIVLLLLLFKQYLNYSFNHFLCEYKEYTNLTETNYIVVL